jgi:anti-anti-sigma factor
MRGRDKMEIRHSDQMGRCVIQLIGALNRRTASEVAGKFEEILALGRQYFVLDLFELVELDSSGMGPIIAMARELRDRHGTLTIRFKLESQLRTTLQRFNLHRSLPVEYEDGPVGLF